LNREADSKSLLGYAFRREVGRRVGICGGAWRSGDAWNDCAGRNLESSMLARSKNRLRPSRVEWRSWNLSAWIVP